MEMKSAVLLIHASPAMLSIVSSVRASQCARQVLRSEPDIVEQLTCDKQSVIYMCHAVAAITHHSGTSATRPNQVALATLVFHQMLQHGATPSMH